MHPTVQGGGFIFEASGIRRNAGGPIAPGSTLISSPQELSRLASAEELDRTRAALLGTEIESSPNRTQAAYLLWETLHLVVPKVPPPVFPTPEPYRPRAHMPMTPVEILILEYSPSPASDGILKTLGALARRLVVILHRSGRRVMTLDQAVEILVDHKVELDTSQDIRTMLGWSLGALLRSGLIRKQSFAEFSKLNKSLL